MSTFGRLFRVTTYGESHCRSVGCIVDGCPPGLPLSEEIDIQPQLNRRRPGQSSLTTPRNEKDRVTIESGVEHGFTLGTPIAMKVLNQDFRPADYVGKKTIDMFPRPSHADYTYLEKYGIHASSGGGRSSARETIGRVAAGAIADKYLKHLYGVEIVAYVSSIGKECAFANEQHRPDDDNNNKDHHDTKKEELARTITRAQVEAAGPTRCPVSDAARRMELVIEGAKDKENSVGGTILCVVRNIPSGIGEPCFDKLEAMLAHAMLSIPASKAFEIGSGFEGTRMMGSEHNDVFVVGGLTKECQTQDPDHAEAAAGNSHGADPATFDPHQWIGDRNLSIPKLTTKTNHSGGVQGGISNGMPITFTVGFKPAATFSLAQHTASYDGRMGMLEARGRHDPSVVPRAVPIVEAMTALVLIDAVFAQERIWFERRALRDMPGRDYLPHAMVGKIDRAEADAGDNLPVSSSKA